MPHPARIIATAMSLAWALGVAAGTAHANERFVQNLPVAAGLVAVVAEGDFEARSTGSYSVRAYFDPSARPEDETTFYTAGLLRPRDGTVRSIALLEGPPHERPLLMVVVQSAGSGGYLSADALAVGPRSVRLRASVSGLLPGDDPAAHLRRKLVAARP